MNEFTEEELEEVVIPLRRVAVDFGQALYLTFLKADANDREYAWKNFADELAMFVKLMEEE